MQKYDVNIGELTPLTPQIISRQATINIGTIGHVAHGKSTLVRAISGVNVSTIKTFPQVTNFEYRPCATTGTASETSQSNSVMQTPSSTSAQHVSPPSASNPLGQRKKTVPSARLLAVSRLSSLSGTSPSSIAQVTMS